jgi:hypothetical protein
MIRIAGCSNLAAYDLRFPIWPVLHVAEVFGVRIPRSLRRSSTRPEAVQSLGQNR